MLTVHFFFNLKLYQFPSEYKKINCEFLTFYGKHFSQKFGFFETCYQVETVELTETLLQEIFLHLQYSRDGVGEWRG